jgi:threonine dehydratase
VVTPHSAPKVKRDALKFYGAEITYSEATLASREAETKKLIEKTGAHLIHPYDNDFTICGQGTASLELLNETGELDYIFTPVGGGGLLSGSAISAKNLFPNIKVFGAEPELANDAYLSLKNGKLYPPLPPKTIADGLRTALCERTFSIIQNYVDEIVLVSEQEIIEATRLLWERMKIIVEPSGAVPLAAVLKNKEKFSGKKIGIILSGGNVDLKQVLMLF